MPALVMLLLVLITSTATIVVVAGVELDPVVRLLDPAPDAVVGTNKPLEFKVDVRNFAVGEGLGLVVVELYQHMDGAGFYARCNELLYDFSDLSGVFLYPRDFQPGMTRLQATAMNANGVRLTCPTCSHSVPLNITFVAPEAHQGQEDEESFLRGGAATDAAAAAAAATIAAEKKKLSPVQPRQGLGRLQMRVSAPTSDLNSVSSNCTLTLAFSFYGKGCNGTALSVFVDDGFVMQLSMEGGGGDTVVTFPAHLKPGEHKIRATIDDTGACTRVDGNLQATLHVRKTTASASVDASVGEVGAAGAVDVGAATMDSRGGAGIGEEGEEGDPQSRDAVVTYVATDNMVAPLLVLRCAVSSRMGAGYLLVALLDPMVTEEAEAQLIEADFIVVRLDPQLTAHMDESTPYIKRKALAKLQAWSMRAIRKGLFLEMDVLIQEDLGYLFQFPFPSIAAGGELDQVVDTGIFLFRPDTSIFQALVQRLVSNNFVLDPLLSHLTENPHLYTALPAKYSFRPISAQAYTAPFHPAVVHMRGAIKPWEWFLNGRQLVNPTPTAAEHMAVTSLVPWFAEWSTRAHECLVPFVLNHPNWTNVATVLMKIS